MGPFRRRQKPAALVEKANASSDAVWIPTKETFWLNAKFLPINQNDYIVICNKCSIQLYSLKQGKLIRMFENDNRDVQFIARLDNIHFVVFCEESTTTMTVYNVFESSIVLKETFDTRNDALENEGLESLVPKAILQAPLTTTPDAELPHQPNESARESKSSEVISVQSNGDGKLFVLTTGPDIVIYQWDWKKAGGTVIKQKVVSGFDKSISTPSFSHKKFSNVSSFFVTYHAKPVSVGIEWTGFVDQMAIDLASGFIDQTLAETKKDITIWCSATCKPISEKTDMTVSNVAISETYLVVCFTNLSVSIYSVPSFSFIRSLGEQIEEEPQHPIVDAEKFAKSFNRFKNYYPRRIRILPNFAILQKIWCLIFPNDKYLFIGTLCSVQVYDRITGEMKWNFDADIPISFSSFIPNNQFVIVFWNGEVLFDKFPEGLFPEELHSPAAVLEQALSNCLSNPDHLSNISQQCDKIIRYENCRASFSEWCSAHNLLQLAVNNNEISRDTKYNGHVSWWFDQLYICAKDFELGEDDKEIVRSYLEEAKKGGVIESIDAVLGAVHVSEDLRDVKRTLQTADVFLLHRVINLEARFQDLQTAFEKYRERQMIAQLICVAFHIIPIAGGAIAGVASAGQEFVAGFSIKDLTDYLLGLGCSLAQDQTTSLSERVFSIAGKTLQEDALANMNVEERRRLEETVAPYGFDLHKLRELFLEQVNPNETKEVDITELKSENMTEGLQECVKHPVQSDKGELIINAETHKNAVHKVDEIPAIKPEVEEETIDNNLESSVTFETGSSSLQDERRVRALEKKSPSDWKEASFDQINWDCLSIEQLASFWAAFILDFDDNRTEKYHLLCKELCDFLEQEYLNAARLRSRLVTPSEVVDCVMTYLKHNGVKLKLGEKSNLDEFVDQVCKDK